MKHVIVVNVNSEFGAIHAVGAIGFVSVTGSKDRHPVIECIELDLINHHYVFARSRLTDTQEYQAIWFPHHCVVAIYQYDEAQTLPIGFAPNL
jgi:hypothetical protein